MVTVVVSTTNRPAMLRTALRSIDRQTARDQITQVIVSENALGQETAAICAEFPTLPIEHIFRDPPLRSLDHGVALFTEAAELPSSYTAILHDDDWWGIHHLENGLRELQRQPDALAYWTASFFVRGESSWYLQCWNEAVWIASDFPPTTEVVKLNRKQAALACVGGGAAAYTSLVAKKEVLRDCFAEVSKSGNLFDNDRLLFLEMAKHGPLLVNLVPEVFVRLHRGQDQSSFSFQESAEHVAAGTRAVLAFCKEEGIDVLREFDRLHHECPIQDYRPYLTATFDTRVRLELERQQLMPLNHLSKPARTRDTKWFLEQLCPPVGWKVARRLYQMARPQPPRLNRPVQ